MDRSLYQITVHLERQLVECIHIAEKHHLRLALLVTGFDQFIFLDLSDVPLYELSLVWPELADLQCNRLADFRVVACLIVCLFRLDTGRATNSHVERQNIAGVACFLGDFAQSGRLIRFTAVPSTFGQDVFITLQQMEDADLSR